MGYRNLNKNDKKLTPLLKDYARQEADSFAHSKIDDYLNWFSKPKNREDFEAALRFVDKHLPKVLFVLEQMDGRRLPTIRETQGENTWRGSVVRYLVEFGQLRWLANYVSDLNFRKKAYAKKMCAQDLAGFFRDNIGRPAYFEIGEILLEKFPQKGNGNASEEDLARWVKQIIKR